MLQHCEKIADGPHHYVARPDWIAEFGKSLSFPSTASPEAGIPQSAYRYTGEFRGKYTGNSCNREPAPVFHLLIDAPLTTALVSPIRRTVEPN
jgi:hypothetical protein